MRRTPPNRRSTDAKPVTMILEITLSAPAPMCSEYVDRKVHAGVAGGLGRRGRIRSGRFGRMPCRAGLLCGRRGCVSRRRRFRGGVRRLCRRLCCRLRLLGWNRRHSRFRRDRLLRLIGGRRGNSRVRGGFDPGRGDRGSVWGRRASANEPDLIRSQQQRDQCKRAECAISRLFHGCGNGSIGVSIPLF